MNSKSIVLDMIVWIFGIATFIIGLLNLFWGNDPGLGVFILLFSFAYFPPVNIIFAKWAGFSIPVPVKIFRGIFTMWAAFGLGELFDKIKLGQQD